MGKIMKIQSKTQQGFTLIELMITVAIIGVLSAIALPSYTEYVTKGKRTEAKVELLRIAQMQESYFAQNLSYAKNLKQLGFTENSIDSEEDLYDITMPAGGLLPLLCDPSATPSVPCTAYTLTAMPDSSEAQSGDTHCKGFMIDSVSRKSAYGDSLTGFGTTSAHITNTKKCW